MKNSIVVAWALCLLAVISAWTYPTKWGVELFLIVVSMVVAMDGMSRAAYSPHMRGTKLAMLAVPVILTSTCGFYTGGIWLGLTHVLIAFMTAFVAVMAHLEGRRRPDPTP